MAANDTTDAAQLLILTYLNMITSATLESIRTSYQIPQSETNQASEQLADFNIMNETMTDYIGNVHSDLLNVSAELEELETDMNMRRDAVSDSLASLIEFIGQDRQAALDDLNEKMSAYYNLILQVHGNSSFAADSAEMLLSELFLAEKRHNTSRDVFSGINVYIPTVEKKIQLVNQELSGLDTANITDEERQTRETQLSEELERLTAAKVMQDAVLDDPNCEIELMSQFYEAATGLNNAIDNYRNAVSPLAQSQLEDFMMKKQQHPVENKVIAQLRSAPNRPRDVSLNDSK